MEVHFQLEDIVVFVLLLCASLAIGMHSACAGGKEGTAEEYLHGNRKLRLLPVGMSFVASYLSAIVLLGNPAEAYFHGVQLIFHAVGLTVACVSLAFLFVPVIYPLRLTSMFEYLELRYESRATRLVGTTINIFSEVSWAGLTMYAPALCLRVVVGVPEWISICAIATVSTIYTSIGGIRAVVWTDVLQAFIMIGTLITVVVVGTVKVGGISRVIDELHEGRRLEIDLDPDPTKRMTLGIILVGGTSFATCLLFGQAAVQRFSSLPTMKDAKLMYLLSPVGFVVLHTLSLAAGCVAYVYYDREGCDPLTAGYISNSNQILPYFVADLLRYPGFNGLFMACIFSAVLSTVSSIQNSVAATAWEDFLQWKFAYVEEGTKILILKATVVVIGAISIVVGLVANRFGGTLIQIVGAVVGAALGPRTAMFVLGAAVPIVGSLACSLAAISGFAACIALAVLNMLNPAVWSSLPTSIENCTVDDIRWTTFTALDEGVTGGMSGIASPVTSGLPYHYESSSYATSAAEPAGSFYHLASFYYALFGFVITVFLALVFSIIPMCRNKKAVHPRYLFPCCRRFCSNYVRDVQKNAEGNIATNSCVLTRVKVTNTNGVNITTSL